MTFMAVDGKYRASISQSPAGVATVFPREWRDHDFWCGTQIRNNHDRNL